MKTFTATSLALVALCSLGTSAYPSGDVQLVERQDGTTTLTPVDPNTGLPLPSKRSLSARTDEQDLSSSGQKVKRITSANPVNVCTARQIGLGFDEFETSYCARTPPGLGGSAQDWNMRCHNGLASILDSGSCASNQICVDGVIDAETGHRQAECVGTELFVSLAKSITDVTSRRAVRITPGNTRQTSNMMEVALTKTWDKTIAYEAAHITLEAQDVNGKTIVPLKGQTSVIQCDHCPSIGLQPWPANTASFLATVTLNLLADEVTLFVANIVP